MGDLQRFQQISANLRKLAAICGNLGKSPIWKKRTPTYYTFLESSRRGGHFGVYIDQIVPL